MSEDITGYSLSRRWFDFCFENPEKINPSHTALYFFAIEHCNRLGWKQKFGLPTTMAMEAIGIRSYNTYKKTITDLVSFGFIKMVEISKNQYSSNIVSLTNLSKSALSNFDKALTKHLTKQSESTVQSIDSIDKLITNNIIYIGGQSKMPKAEDVGELAEIKIGAAIELLKITKQQDISPPEILAMWEVFKKQNCTGSKYYADHSAIESHFINWLKTQKFESGNSKNRIRNQSELREIANRTY